MLKLKFQGRMGQQDIKDLRQKVLEECRRGGVSREASYQFLSLADELACNIMEHSRAHWMEFSFWTDGKKASLKFRDDGLAFDPVARSGKGDYESYLRSGPERRLGLWMVLKLAKRIFYERKKGKVNELTLTTHVSELRGEAVP